MTAKMLCLLSVALLVVGCKHEPGSRAVTSGQLKIGVDEAVYQAFLQEGAEFQSQYQGSNLSFVQYDAREAVILLAADSIRTIVIGRPLNAIESAALSQIKIPVDSHRVAMGGIAVVVHPSNPLTRLRLTQLDSIFSGLVTKWPGNKDVIVPFVGGRMSSTNDIFRSQILGGRDFGPTVEYVDSSSIRLSRIAKSKNAIGIIPMAMWMQGAEKSVKVIELGAPSYRPDSTREAGQYYAPYQAYVWLGYYPLSSPVYLYSRADEQDLAQGFISFVCYVSGQKIIQNSGLVPATQPVRLVSITSNQVQ